MAENKLENVNIEIAVEREYNLGGFRNALKITRKIVGPVNIIKDNLKDIDDVLSGIEVRFGDSIAKSRREIKKLAKEIYDEDGKVNKKKEE